MPTLVKRGSSLGSNATIAPGVTIGECAVIGAGAVVTRDVPAFAIASGNPARVRKQFASAAELAAYMNSRQPERRG